MTKLSRAAFTQGSLGALLACAGCAEETKPDNRCVPGVSVGQNHGHVAVLAYADIEAGVETSYDVRGTSAHNHTYTLTAEHLQQLKSGQGVTVDTTRESGHIHTVTLICTFEA